MALQVSRRRDAIFHPVFSRSGGPKTNLSQLSGESTKNHIANYCVYSRSNSGGREVGGREEDKRERKRGENREVEGEEWEEGWW